MFVVDSGTDTVIIALSPTIMSSTSIITNGYNLVPSPEITPEYSTGS